MPFTANKDHVVQKVSNYEMITNGTIHHSHLKHSSLDFTKQLFGQVYLHLNDKEKRRKLEVFVK